MRGEMTVYPTNTGDNQIASEKIMHIDYSHFNINGRVFGAMGAEADGFKIPDIAITGGFATEDQVYKALALGSPYT